MLVCDIRFWLQYTEPKEITGSYWITMYDQRPKLFWECLPTTILETHGLYMLTARVTLLDAGYRAAIYDQEPEPMILRTARQHYTSNTLTIFARTTLFRCWLLSTVLLRTTRSQSRWTTNGFTTLYRLHME